MKLVVSQRLATWDPKCACAKLAQSRVFARFCAAAARNGRHSYRGCVAPGLHPSSTSVETLPVKTVQIWISAALAHARRYPPEAGNPSRDRTSSLVNPPSDSNRR
jgi:hypothetical protein